MVKKKLFSICEVSEKKRVKERKEKKRIKRM